VLLLCGGAGDFPTLHPDERIPHRRGGPRRSQWPGRHPPRGPEYRPARRPHHRPRGGSAGGGGRAGVTAVLPPADR
jgi:hypothetical protein